MDAFISLWLAMKMNESRLDHLKAKSTQRSQDHPKRSENNNNLHDLHDNHEKVCDKNENMGDHLWNKVDITHTNLEQQINESASEQVVNCNGQAILDMISVQICMNKLIPEDLLEQ